MEYERRRVRWYWVTLFLMYGAAMVYGVLVGNPFLYSHQEYNRELSATPTDHVDPVPSPKAQPALSGELGRQSYFSRLNQEHTGDFSSDLTLGKNFLETEVAPLPLPEDFHPTTWSMDESGVFLGGGQAIEAFEWNGTKLWEFRFSPSVKSISDVLSDKQLVYMIGGNGEIATVNKKSGQLQWNLRLNEEVVGPSQITDDRLLVPIKSHITDPKLPRPMFRWAVIKRRTGEVTTVSKPLDGKAKFQLSMVPELGIWILAFDNKIEAVDPEKLEVLWSQTLTDPIRGSVTVVGHSLFAATIAGKIIKLDGSKKGRQEWEVELARPPVSSPTFLPIMTKLAVLDDQGQLEVVDAKAGKALWHFNIESKGDLREVWAARLKGMVIQELNMDWSHRGWTIWAPCSHNRFCVYNPKEGQLISRVPLSGSPLALPVEKEKALYFLIDQGKNWAISRIENEKKKPTTTASQKAVD